VGEATTPLSVKRSPHQKLIKMKRENYNSDKGERRKNKNRKSAKR